MFDILDAAMSEMEADSKKGITIRLHSPGGCVYEALAIVGRIKSSKCYVTIEGYGHMMSAAALILACGDKRKMSIYAFFMHHEASYRIEGRHGYIKAEVDQMDKEEEEWCKWMEEFTKESNSFWKEKGLHVNFYLDAKQCLKHGIVDELM